MKTRVKNCLAVACTIVLLADPTAVIGYPVHRPPRKVPAAREGNYAVHPDQLNQVIKGIGFEIQRAARPGAGRTRASL
jgi:hypothetical protein